MNIQRPSCALVAALIATQVFGPAVLWAADQRGIRVEANRRVLIAAISGEQLMAQSGGDSKALHFRDAVNVGDQIATGDRTVADVLIGNRAVVTLGQSTTAQFTAVSEDQMILQVKKGIVRVAASAVALGAQGKITIQTPTGQVQTRGGIIRVTVDAPVGSAEHMPIGEARPYLASYSPNTIVAAVNTRGEIIQVEEGTAEIPGAGPGGGALTVKSGQAVTLQSGQAGPIAGLVNQGSMRAGVLASAGHNSTPKEGLDNLVALQVDQATALGKALTGAAETGEGDSGKKDESKNALNGATGGVTLNNPQVLNAIFNQPAPATSGTLTFQSSQLNVSGNLALVESADTNGVRDSNSQAVSFSASRATINPTNALMVVERPQGVLSIGTSSTIPTANNFIVQGANNRSTYTNQVDGGTNDPEPPVYALTGMSLSGSGSTQTAIFNAGVKITNSTANWVTATDAVKINSPNTSASGSDVGHVVQFNDSALVAQGSTLQGSLQNLLQANGGGSTNLTQVNAPAGRSLVQLIDSTSTSQGGITLDFAILEASAPLIALYGTVVGDVTNRTQMNINGSMFALDNDSHITNSSILPMDALVSLNAATLTINGSLLSINNGSTVSVSTLAFLQNGSVLNLTGPLVSFGLGGGTLTLTASCSPLCNTSLGFPVLLQNGAAIGNISRAAGYTPVVGPGTIIQQPIISSISPTTQTGGSPYLVLNGPTNRVSLRN